MTGLGLCAICRALFEFNIFRVPRVPREGELQPICRDCLEGANGLRAQHGLPLIDVGPGAYDVEVEDGQ